MANVQDENHNLHQQQQQDIDDTEEEDRLSFCDLPLYGDAAIWEEFSGELHHQTSSSSSSSSSSRSEDQQQYFEFFTEEWNSPDTNIIFCGKLIPYKQVPLQINSNPSDNSFSSKSNVKGTKFAHKYDFPVRKVSMLTSPAKKSRWYLLMFGLARFPMDNMELRDMRRRQSRKITKSPGGEKSNGLTRGKGGLWRMLRALGCSGQNHATAAVKAAYGCAPQLAGE
ncbi:hypothetical protein LguiB_003374 [Lonicera macranthoides]